MGPGKTWAEGVLNCQIYICIYKFIDIDLLDITLLYMLNVYIYTYMHMKYMYTVFLKNINDIFILYIYTYK